MVDSHERFFQKKQYKYLIYLLKVLVLFSIYFTTARLGLSFDAVSGFATLIWFPSGIAMASLLLFGYRLWPGITLAAFLVNFLVGAPFFVALGIGVGNTLEALIGAYLLNRFRFSKSLDHLRDILLLVLLAMPMSAFISATTGVSSLFLGRLVSITAILPTWKVWWVGDMISILIITPLLLLWITYPRRKVSLKCTIEIGLLTLVILTVGIIVFLKLLHKSHEGYPITYLVFPPLIWAALRFGQRGALSAIFAFSVFANIGKIEGLSPFLTGKLSGSLFLLQSFLGIITVTTMILAAITAERKEIEQRKDIFIGMAGHELKTPLTSIKALSDYLHRKFTKAGDQDSAALLGRMNTQIDKLNALITDLLDVTRIESGKLYFHTTYFSFDELVDEIIEELQRTTEKHTLIREGYTKKNLCCDRERTGQVMTNFLSNAIKYTPNPGNIIITTTATNQLVTFTVQDFGLGIAREKQPYIFERFYREPGPTERTYPGLGLGLYICKEIIKHMGGRVWVCSEKGKGSTFGFSLPIK